MARTILGLETLGRIVSLPQWALSLLPLLALHGTSHAVQSQWALSHQQGRAATVPAPIAVPSTAPGAKRPAAGVAGLPAHFRSRSTLSLRAQHCVGQAAAFHRVNADILHAIILVESDGRPSVVNRNRNGTLDIGMAQINSIHLPELSRYGIQAEHLFDECVAAFVAAWHYGRQVRRLGNTWQAIGAYHSRTPQHNQRYQRLVFERLIRLGVLPDTRLATSTPRAHSNSSTPAATPRTARSAPSAPTSAPTSEPAESIAALYASYAR